MKKTPTIVKSLLCLTAGLLTSVASAQFTYPGNANLNANQIYDGLGVDSGLNPCSMGTTGDGDYIGTGAGNSGALTVLSGSLTITNSDFKVGVNGGTGALYLGQNATLNIASVGSWGAGIGQNSSSVATLVVSNNATLNFNVGGSQEQRVTWGVNTASIVATIIGGAINVTNGTGTSDDQRGFSIGAQNGQGTVNLIAGTVTDSMPLPFGLGGQYQTMNTAPTWVDSSTISSLIISNGSFVMTGICPTTDGSKATFGVGTNSYVVFYNGTGSLSLANWTSSDFETLVNNGQIRIGLPGQTPIVTTISHFAYSSVGGQGILKVAPFVLPPTIAGQPQSQYVVTGTTLNLNATGISGNTPFTFQWQLGGTNLQNNANFSGVNSNILTIANAALGNTGPYRLIVTNLYGSVTSSVANLVVQSPALLGAWLNDGSTNLVDVSGYPLAAAHQAMVTGAGNYMFTNDVPLGKTGQSLFFYNGDTALAISNSSTADASYDNTFDDVINNQFSVMFWAKGVPSAWNPFVSKAGDTVGWQIRSSGNTNNSMFTVRGTGGTEDMATTSFPTGDGNWHLYAGTFDAITGERKLYVGGVLAASDTNNVKYSLAGAAHLSIGAREDLTASPSAFSAFQIFRVQLYNYAIPLSQVLTELGVQPPAISGQPQSLNALVSRLAQIKATGISGTAPLTYQWKLNGVDIQALADSANFTGANSNILTILSVAPADAGSYQLTVTSPYGTAISSNAILTLKYPSLVGHWFVGTTNLNDVSGYTPTNTHDGMPIGSGSYQFATDVPAGHHGESLDLSTGDSGIAINNSSTSDGTYANTFDDAMHDNMSFAFWSKGYPVNWNPWVSKGGDDGNMGWSMRTIGWSAGWGNWEIFTMRGTGATVSGGDDLGNNSGTTDGAWHHYAGTYNSVTGLRTLYRDGVQTAQSTGNGLYNMAITSHLAIGAKDAGNGAYGNYFTGKFYDVRVYNYDLSAAEIGAFTNLPNPSASNPTSISTYLGGVARMISTVSGTGTLTNHWQLNGVNLVDGTYGSVVISGATTPILTISNVTVGYAGAYRLIVSNTNGVDTSNPGTLTVNSPALIGQWFTGAADSYADVSGYTLAGTHDAVAIQNASFVSDVPPGKTGVSLSVVDGGVIINNSATGDSGYTNTFDDKISSAFTVMFWAKGYPQGWNPWMSKNGDSGLGWQARTPSWGTNFPMFTVRGTGSASGDDQSAWSNPDANWHNYACTFDGGTGRRTMYMDGTQLFQSTDNKPYTLAPSSHLAIGVRDAGGFSYGTTFYTGGFYDVRVYNYPLTYGAIAIYNNVAPSFSGSAVLAGNGITLQWAFGTLLGSTNVAGPYLPVPGATSPYTNDVSTAPQMFFKLSNP